MINLGRLGRTRHVARMEVRRGAYRVLVGRHEGRRSLGRSKLGREDNVKMDFQKFVGGGGRRLD